MFVKKQNVYYWFIQPEIPNISKEKKIYSDYALSMYRAKVEGEISYIKIIPEKSVKTMQTDICLVLESKYKPGKIGLIWDDSRDMICLTRNLQNGKVYYIFGQAKQDDV